MPNLVKKLQNISFRSDLFKVGSKIILAVSGGPDSVAMLDVFLKLQKKYSLKLAVTHANYGLRGSDSERDEKFVRKLAEEYKLEIFVLRPLETHCNASLRRRKNISEDTLRKIRYDFFEKIRADKKFDLIAVAHNADDQVETFLLRIIRGAGLSGLSSMRHKNGKIIRPLLGIFRFEILEYLKKNKLHYRLDKTNFENKYLRNKIRNKLVPYLEKNFNPSIRKTIIDSVSSICEDQAFLLEAAEREYKQMRGKLSVEKISKLSISLQRGILRKALEKKKGNLKNIESPHIEEIMKIIKSTKSKRQVVLFSGLKVERSGDRLEISHT